MRNLRLSGSILPQTELFYFVAFYGLVRNGNAYKMPTKQDL